GGVPATRPGPFSPPGSPVFPDLNESAGSAGNGSRPVSAAPIKPRMTARRAAAAVAPVTVGGRAMRGTRSGGRWIGGAVLGVLLVTGVGCFHTLPHHPGIAEGPPIAVPPPGAGPVELRKVTLPPYVLEAPDNLLIQVFVRAEVPVGDLKMAQPPVLTLPPPEKKPEEKKDEGPKTEVQRPLPVQDISGSFLVRIDGTVALGFWGSVPVAGLTLDQAAAAIRQHLLQQDTLRPYRIQPNNLIVIV